jgi:Transposase IS66 family/Sulfotransferase family
VTSITVKAQDTAPPGGAGQIIDHAPLVPRKIQDLRYYDALGMDDVVAVSAWGRSASLLLASFLDGHDDIVMLPGLHSEQILEFFERNSHLSLRDRLLAYPRYCEEHGRPFHYGDFIIFETDYRAAVDALLAVYGDRSPALLAARRTFFQFVYVAYGLARGRRPAKPRPLMVFVQHNWEEAVARRLIQDFPKARFIHTVRHPVACFKSSFERNLYLGTADGQLPQPAYLKPVTDIIAQLTKQDRPHPGTADRTRAIRFEDMHLYPHETMRSIVAWLQLPWRPSLDASTFNGVPYLIERGATDWVGSRPEQVRNPMRNVARRDQALLFALFYEDFVAWDLPCPMVVRKGWLRRLIGMALWVMPLSMELKAAREILRVQVLPALRSGAFTFAARSALRPLSCHVAVARLVSAELRQRVGWRVGQFRGLRECARDCFRILRPTMAADHSLEAAPGAKVGTTIGDRVDADRLAIILLAEYDVALAAFGKGGRIAPPETRRHQPWPTNDIGQAVALLGPIVNLIREHVFAADALHATDAPVPVPKSSPQGSGQGRVWIYVRDDRSFCGPAPPAVALFYSLDRSLAQRSEHLRHFAGFLQTHTGSVFARPSQAGGGSPGAIIEVACWARCRLKFCEILEFTGSALAAEALSRIAAIHAIDAAARFEPAVERVARRAIARPLVEAFFAWAEASLRSLDGKSGLAAAFRYMLDRRLALTRFLDHGCLDIDNSATEPVLSGLAWFGARWNDALGGGGGECAAAAYSVMQTARLNGIDVRVYLRDAFAQLLGPGSDESVSRLLPWNWSRR